MRVLFADCGDYERLHGVAVGQMDERTGLGSGRQRELQVVARQLATAASQPQAWWKQEGRRSRRRRHFGQISRRGTRGVVAAQRFRSVAHHHLASEFAAVDARRQVVQTAVVCRRSGAGQHRAGRCRWWTSSGCSRRSWRPCRRHTGHLRRTARTATTDTCYRLRPRVGDVAILDQTTT